MEKSVARAGDLVRALGRISQRDLPLPPSKLIVADCQLYGLGLDFGEPVCDLMDGLDALTLRLGGGCWGDVDLGKIVTVTKENRDELAEKTWGLR